MQQGLTDYAATGTTLYREWYLALLAEVYGDDGQISIALDTLAEAMAVARDLRVSCWEPEFNRLKGQLLLQQSPDNATEAESCFQQAISIAQNQSAKSWELRAATSLARLWQSQGKRDEARELLEPVYDWFTEGFDTADLKDAKALLDELA
jgi:predicted ATPase